MPSYNSVKKRVRSAPLKGLTPRTMLPVSTPSTVVTGRLMAPNPTRMRSDCGAKAWPMPACDASMRER